MNELQEWISERYASLLRCAGRAFLFSRHDMGDHKRMQTLVRVTQPVTPRATAAATANNNNRHGAAAAGSGGAAVGGGGRPAGNQTFSAAEVGLPHKLLMSHNAAFLCVHGRMLVAYGGMTHTADQPDWQGNDVGIVRSVADAAAWPLRWSTPQLSISGDEAATGCVDENAESTVCEYDGKLSVVAFRGSVLLFTRSNLSPAGGARHVQV